MRPTSLVVPVLICLLAVADGVRAAESYQADRPSTWSGTPDTYQAPWREGAGALPAAPRRKNLMALFSYELSPDFEFYVDPMSLSLARDEVFRYTVVIRSASGTTNVLYEGLRCETRQFKTYAYLSGRKFYPVANPAWGAVNRIGTTAYRFVLMDEFVCGESGHPEQLDHIQARLKRSDRDGKRKLKLFKKDWSVDSKS